MSRNYIEELVNAIRTELQAEERLVRSERIKEGWCKRKESIAREKDAMALV